MSTPTRQSSALSGRSTAERRALRRPDLRLRSLTVKLTLAFLCVGLIGAVLVAFFVGQLTQRAFNQFVNDRGRNAVVAELQQYYRTHGDWNGVGAVWQADRGGDRRGDERRQPVVAAANGEIVAGGGPFPAGRRVSPAERAQSVPIEVDGVTVGYLINAAGYRGPGPGTAEANFLARIMDAITLSAVGATIVALLLGILLARTLTHPLRELTAATQAVAKGALGQQVAVRSRDELGLLASSFNQMSADLAHASALRRQMTADIAHDLRTPLSVILGYTEALRDGKLPGTDDVFDTMHTEAQHLQRLIDDLRTLSLADAGELPLARQLLAPRTLLERAAAAHRAQAQAQHVTLAVDVAGELPLIAVDPERMAQVLGNLLGNSLRYTPAGGTIQLRSARAAGGVQLQVADSGVGIAPDALPHIFERFYRADQSRQQTDGSSGLGLAIARSIVEAHGGTIRADSTLGQGTTFSMSLPTDQPATGNDAG